MTTKTAQFTPLISEVMAHYNLSDDEWDCLSSFTKQKLSTVYAKHAAAPAMYEALKFLTSEIDLSKLNVRKDFSLMNAHAWAIKVILQAEGKLL